MASPAPYSKPRRSKLRNKVITFRTRKGSRVYAPVSGILKQKGRSLTLTTKGGWVHKISNTRPVKQRIGEMIQVGERVGTARGRKIRYIRRTKTGGLRDGMPTVTKNNNEKSGNWMPGVKRVRASGGGDMSTGGGNEVKVVWHTTESSDARGVIDTVAKYVVNKNVAYHILWNPKTGEIVQLYPANVAARALENASNLATNRHGKLCIQVSIVGKASDRPLKAGKDLKGRRNLMEWFDGHGIPRKAIDSDSRSREMFTRSGHTNHRSAPGNTHTDLYMTKHDWKKLLAP